MNKKLIRLTEEDLHRIVKESTKKILKEGNYTERMSAEMLLNDIFGGKLERFGWDDVEAYGKSGRRYRILISNDHISVAWSPEEEPNWEEGGEFVIRGDEKGFRTIVAYLQEFA